MTTSDVSAPSLAQRLRANPRDVEALIEAGTRANSQNDLEAAKRLLRRAVALAPRDPRGRFALALALRNGDEIEEALPHARAAWQLLPSHGGTVWIYGSLLRMTGKAEEAVRILAPVCRLRSAIPRHHRDLGQALQQLGRYDEALESLGKARALEPDNVWFKCAEASILAERDARRELAGREDAKRVGLHLNQPFHYALLRPIFDALRAGHHCLLTDSVVDLRRFDPDVVIVSDAQAKGMRPLMPRAAFVYTRHGLISKNHAFPAARLCDYICVSSEAVGELAVEKGGFAPDEVWVTGYVQMDPLFAGEDLALPFELAPGRETLLYAPTYNAKISSAPMLGERLVALLRGRRRDLNVIIKPHPVSFKDNPDWIAWWRQMAENEPAVHLVTDEGADVVPYLQKADLLVSDACSVAYAYLATDRPIILLTNPEHREDPNYDPEGVEWRWRDIGEALDDVEALPDAVARALDAPEAFAERRAHYRRLLFGALTDGRAAQRIAERVTALAP